MKKNEHSYSALLSEREYIKNLTAEIINRFGDSLDAIAFSWLVYTLTDSTALTAAAYGVNMLVSVILLPFCGVLVTNMSKKTVAVISDVCRGFLVCVTIALYLTGVLRPWMLIVFTGLMSAFEAFRIPAGAAIFPLIVPKEKYTAAAALSGSASKAAELIGKGLAGVIIAAFGAWFALAADAATFFVSAFISAALKLPDDLKTSVKTAFNGYGANMRSGLKYFAGNKLVIALCLSCAAFNFTLCPLFSLQPPYVSESLKLGAEGLSLLGTASSLGILAGSAIYPKLVQLSSRFRLYIAGMTGAAASCAGLAAIPFAPADWLKMALLAIVMTLFGVCAAIVNTGNRIGFMEKTDRTQIARISGLMNAACAASIPFGTFITAGLSRRFSVAALFLGSGIAALITAVSFLFVKPLRKID